MRDDIAIKVEHVSKKYCRSLRHTMLYGMLDIARNAVGISSGSEALRKDEFWALDDISFEVRKGETLGIIGANGSGKTTLLKLINGILLPDKGRITLHGRIGALIEVGAGFHPMLTGRENIYINGAILGMSRKEIDRKFDEIVDFADIGDFLDVPVKHYSSGMYVRLGFSVAVHCEPDILLVDEVLAVGDEQFQRRCLNKIGSLQREGKAIVFVSHALTTVEGVCSRVLWMEKGINRTEGMPAEVIEGYLKKAGKPSPRNGRGAGTKRGTRDAEIVHIGLFNGGNERVESVDSGEEAAIAMDIRFNRDVDNPVFGIIIKNENGAVAYGMNSRWKHMTFETFGAGEQVRVTFRQKMQLSGGLYHIDAAVSYADGLTFCDSQDNALGFAVNLPVQIMGMANLDSQISVTRISKGIIS